MVAADLRSWPGGRWRASGPGNDPENAVTATAILMLFESAVDEHRDRSEYDTPHFGQRDHTIRARDLAKQLGDKLAEQDTEVIEACCAGFEREATQPTDTGLRPSRHRRCRQSSRSVTYRSSVVPPETWARSQAVSGKTTAPGRATSLRESWRRDGGHGRAT
jgi:hypothetical protein